MSIEPDAEARAIVENAQREELRRFAMDLELLVRRTPRRRAALKGVLFARGDITEAGEKSEQAEDDVG
jgi:hypothetical protein